MSGAPLRSVTDLFVRPQDGALYFTVGGRGTTSALYRVTHVREVVRRAARWLKPTAGSNSVAWGTGSKRGASIDLAWSNLGHSDRAVRHAARLAVERLPVAGLARLVLWPKDNPRARIAAMVVTLPAGGAGRPRPRS